MLHAPRHNGGQDFEGKLMKAVVIAGKETLWRLDLNFLEAAHFARGAALATIKFKSRIKDTTAVSSIFVGS